MMKLSSLTQYFDIVVQLFFSCYSFIHHIIRIVTYKSYHNFDLLSRNNHSLLGWVVQLFREADDIGFAKNFLIFFRKQIIRCKIIYQLYQGFMLWQLYTIQQLASRNQISKVSWKPKNIVSEIKFTKTRIW